MTAPSEIVITTDTAREETGEILSGIHLITEMNMEEEAGFVGPV